MASTQGSGHILSLSPLFLLLLPLYSPSCFLFFFFSTPDISPVLTSPPLSSLPRGEGVVWRGGFGVGKPEDLRQEQSMMARWSPSELQTNGHFVNVGSGCPRIPLLHHTLEQPASRPRQPGSRAGLPGSARAPPSHPSPSLSPLSPLEDTIKAFYSRI